MFFVYLLVNAVMYLLFGIWCGYSPTGTAEGVGFMLLGNKGTAEYIAVYGGMEFGIGIFYLISAFNPRLHEAAALFSVCFYGFIVLFRSYSLIKFGSDISIGWYFYTAEILFAALALYFYRSISA